MLKRDIVIVNGQYEYSSTSTTMPVPQAEMKKLTEQEVAANCFSKESKRQALGSIAVKDLDLFCANAAAALNYMNIPSQTFVKRIGLHDSPRFEIGPCETAAEIKNLSKKELSAIGLYFEHPTTHVSKDQFSNLKNEDRYIVWVYHTIKGKALTFFRKFLLESILYHENSQ